VRQEIARPRGLRPDDQQTELSAELLTDLSEWRLNLHTRSFTAVSVDMLLRDLRRTVPSALGYTLVLVAAPGLPEVSITVADGRLASGQVLSTLTFDLPVAHEVSAGVTFYAGLAGAFDHLAPLLVTSATFGTGRVQLGGPVEADVEPGVQGLADHTKVNYAIGVLLARGLSLAQADRYLARLADRFGSLEIAADHLLTSFDT
jgi:hypothetical protein